MSKQPGKRSTSSNETTARKAKILRDYFLTRIDKIAAMLSWKVPHPVNGGTAADSERYIDGLINAHITGRPCKVRYATGSHPDNIQSYAPRIGFYTPDQNNLTKWGCIDLDGAGHADALADPLGTARMIAFKGFAREPALPLYLERSGGGNGYHLWLFTEAPVPAGEMRDVLLSLVPTTITTVDGRPGKVEIFPKQRKHKSPKKVQVGNMVWAPWWHGAQDGANEFYCINDAGKLEPTIPDIKTVGVNDIHEIAQAVASTTAATSSAHEDDSDGLAWIDNVEHEPDTKPTADKVQSALDFLDPDAHYDEWLKIGMAIHEWDSDNGYQLYDGWSSRGRKYEGEETTRAKWESFSSSFGGITIASLFRMAIDAGWQPSVKLRSTTADEKPPDSATWASVKPEIQINARHMDEIRAKAWNAIALANKRKDHPFVFRRDRYVVELIKVAGVRQISEMNSIDMEATLVDVASWVRVVEGADKIAAQVPQRLPPMMARRPHSSLPSLTGVVNIPVFYRDVESDIKLLSVPGFHARARLWYEPTRSLAITVDEHAPSVSDVAAAKALILDDMLCDFPFNGQSDLAHAVAAILLPFVRRLIDGPTPLHLFESPTPGTGKGLLANLVSLIANGEVSSARTIPTNEEEMRKAITSELLTGKSIILWDNADEFKRVQSQSLPAVISTTRWSDRALGSNQGLTLENNATWILTANNPRMSMEIARRCVSTRIDATQAQPWLRSPESFKHANLIGWCRGQRARLINAVLVLARHWLEEGAHSFTGQPIGTFGEWSNILGGVLEACEIDGFLGNVHDLYAATDTDTEQWEEFVEAWATELGTRDTRVNELLVLCQSRELLLGLRGDGRDGSQCSRLGHALTRKRDCVYIGQQLLRRKTGTRTFYFLRPVGEGAEEGRDEAKQGDLSEVYDLG